MQTNELKYIRGRLGLTQQEFADKIGYSLSYIQKIEQGTLPITADFMQNFDKAFNVEKRFRSSYNRPHPQKFDWWNGICWLIFLLFIVLFMAIN